MFKISILQSVFVTLTLWLLALYLITMKYSTRRNEGLRVKKIYPEAYIRKEDVKRIIQHAHFIPMGKGWSQRLITENFPGYDWNSICSYLLHSKVIVNKKEKGVVLGEELESSIGVFLDGKGGVIYDKGFFIHSLKSNYIKPDYDKNVSSEEVVSGIDLATGTEVRIDRGRKNRK